MSKEMDSRFKAIAKTIKDLKNNIDEHFIETDKFKTKIINVINAYSTRIDLLKKKNDSMDTKLYQVDLTIGENRGRYEKLIAELEEKIVKAFHDYKGNIDKKLFKVNTLFEKIEKTFKKYITKLDQNSEDIQRVNADTIKANTRISELEQKITEILSKK